MAARMHYIEACGCSQWTLRIWPRLDPAAQIMQPFRCRSWRHAGECRTFKGQQDFARICEAIEAHGHWSHVCLTYRHTTRTLSNAYFRQAVHDWAMLRKRTKRRYKEYKYIQVWEMTRKGCPHCHMAVSNEQLFGELYNVPLGLTKTERDMIGQTNFDNTLGPAALECGFGKVGFIAPIQSGPGMAEYLAKLSAELTGHKKDYQTPIWAPPHFRRLRATRGLLPPIHKNPDMTGELIRAPLWRDAQEKDPATDGRVGHLAHEVPVRT